jgi:predicted ArsR family transcriptional regulator
VPRLNPIDERILRYLSAEDWPVTTEMVAKELKLSWNTAQIHLYSLAARDLVKGKKVGRQNQWLTTRKGRAEAKK